MKIKSAQKQLYINFLYPNNHNFSTIAKDSDLGAVQSIEIQKGIKVFNKASSTIHDESTFDYSQVQTPSQSQVNLNINKS